MEIKALQERHSAENSEQLWVNIHGSAELMEGNRKSWKGGQ